MAMVIILMPMILEQQELLFSVKDITQQPYQNLKSINS